MNKNKIINDPIYGFVSIPDELIFDLIQHPYFQRLRRISQMGLSYLVYPGAHHTRFHHAIGAMHLMQTAVQVLRRKEVAITPEEEQAALIAILLHDIGHGPFSHALEFAIVNNTSHEEISLAIMHKLNEVFSGKLDLAIQIFRGEYYKKFLSQLISSQIDVDRLDYLRRDSFYSGVIEGQVNADRLIKMMYVKDNQLVIEEKGIYSVEKFIISRRLMYWQVYFHKTGMMLEKILEKVLLRVRDLLQNGRSVFLDDALKYLFEQQLNTLDDKSLSVFLSIDDSDIIYHVKKWMHSEDTILSYLSTMVINRQHLNKIIIQKNAFNPERVEEIAKQIVTDFNISPKEIDYLLLQGTLSNKAYDKDKDPIYLLQKNDELIEFSQASDQLNISALSQPVSKFFLSYPSLLKR